MQHLGILSSHFLVYHFFEQSYELLSAFYTQARSIPVGTLTVTRLTFGSPGTPIPFSLCSQTDTAMRPSGDMYCAPFSQTCDLSC